MCSYDREAERFSECDGISRCRCDALQTVTDVRALIKERDELRRCLWLAIQDIEREARGWRPLGFSDGGALATRLAHYRKALEPRKP